MKRSEINSLIKDAEEFFNKMNFLLPPWGYWSLADWKKLDLKKTEIVDNMLGWDLTDFGKGNFKKDGLLLFTIRNGNLNDKKTKPYAEKIMIVEENQVTPYHFHWQKEEDIINRGGGNLVIKLYNSTEDGDFADTPVTLMVDGIEKTFEAGGTLTLTPGESVTLVQNNYHSFWAEAGKGKIMVGEVSAVNDDNTDNRFHEEQSRFPDIEEDEEPYRLLVGDYSKFL
ncbi:MAG: D-lyxose/D-mannose family sugar isomerase [Planctomycetota bacterium]